MDQKLEMQQLLKDAGSSVFLWATDYESDT